MTINMMDNDFLQRFKDNFKDLKQTDLSRLGEFYTHEVLFKDPIHEIRGLVALEDYFTTLSSGLIECRFEYLDQVTSEQSAYLKWIMRFRHSRLGNELIDVRGVSHLRWSDRIEYQEDFYDMGAMLYERVPLLGNVTRWLRLRMAS